MARLSYAVFMQISNMGGARRIADDHLVESRDDIAMRALQHRVKVIAPYRNGLSGNKRSHR